MKTIEESLRSIRARIRDACARSGRQEGEIRVIGATKGVPLERVEEAFSLGLSDFGENYIQEARRKIEGFMGTATWHMIGHLQSNKVKYVPPLFQWVHSVDRWDLLESLDRYGIPLRVLFELNLSGERSKHGAGVEELRDILARTPSLRYVIPSGLMTMPPMAEDPEEARPYFRTLREVLSGMNREFSMEMKELSMGMSSDFEVAIEEGATMVRIGTSLFGERS